MKLGIIIESFLRPLEEGICKARELGADGIQMYAVSKYLNMLTDPREKLQKIKDLCVENHLEISAVCADLGGYGFADLAGNDERLAKTEKIAECAEFLGTKVLTTHIGVVPADRKDPLYSAMVNRLREAASCASAHGLTFAIETGPESPEELLHFLEDVGVRGIGVNMDPANLVMVQNADPASAVKLLGKYIVHTHAKDGVHYRDCDPKRVYEAFATGGFAQLVKETGELFAEVPLGKGSVPWKEYLASLVSSGFDGYLTIERECGDHPEDDVKLALSFLKERLAELEG